MLTQTKLKLPVTPRDHMLGASDAFIVLVEYGEYECRFCGEAAARLKELRAEMGEDLQYVFRNFPMAQLHPFAMNAAKAAEAAALQGRFWPMHDLLMENQAQLDSESLLSYAATLNLDLKKFLGDTDSIKVEERILLDFYGGVRAGVNSTPSFFVNGYRFEGDWRSINFLATLEMFRGENSPAPGRYASWDELRP